MIYDFIGSSMALETQVSHLRTANLQNKNTKVSLLSVKNKRRSPIETKKKKIKTESSLLSLSLSVVVYVGVSRPLSIPYNENISGRPLTSNKCCVGSTYAAYRPSFVKHANMRTPNAPKAQSNKCAHKI